MTPTGHKIAAASKHVALIGMPGVGKSTVGFQLADLLHCPFFDTDRQLEQLVEMSARDYLTQNGEQAFREVEARAVQGLLETGTPSVVAIAAGAVLAPESQLLLSDRAIVVWLRSSLPVLMNRISASGGRVLASTTETLQSRLVEREPIYEALATITIDTDEVSVTDVVNRITTEIGRFRFEQQL